MRLLGESIGRDCIYHVFMDRICFYTLDKIINNPSALNTCHIQPIHTLAVADVV